MTAGKRVMFCLACRSDGTNPVSCLHLPLVRLKAFNTSLIELHSAHCKWKVADADLRRELQARITGVLVDSYKSFMSGTRWVQSCFGS